LDEGEPAAGDGRLCQPTSRASLDHLDAARLRQIAQAEFDRIDARPRGQLVDESQASTWRVAPLTTSEMVGIGRTLPLHHHRVAKGPC
jgi:hypothetical protein